MIIGGITLGLTTVVADTIINSTNVSYKTGTVKAALDDLYGLTADDVWQKIYPVGSIYISVSSKNPSELFGGTWVAFGQGRTLIGVGSIETNTTTNHGTVTPGEINSQVSETRGGEAKHTLTVSEMPRHYHQLCQGDLNPSNTVSEPNPYDGSAGDLVISGFQAVSKWIDPGSSLVGKKCWTNNTSSVGTGLAFSKFQPYITVYMWKRTA